MEQITLAILHKNHDRRSEQLMYLLRSLENLDCRSMDVDNSIIIVGDNPNIDGVDVFESKADSPFGALQELFTSRTELPECVLIFSDDMIVANKCPLSVALIPKVNVDIAGTVSHCPIYALKKMFIDGSTPDKKIPLETIVNRMWGVEPNFKFPVSWKIGPLMGNVVNSTPSPEVVASLFASRYFMHISDNAFPAVEKMLSELFPPTKLEGIIEKTTNSADVDPKSPVADSTEKLADELSDDDKKKLGNTVISKDYGESGK